MSNKESSAETNAQIKQMIHFINQESNEKVEEIKTRTLAACNAEKLDNLNRLEAEAKDKVEKSNKERTTQKKIERSKFVNETRLAAMRNRDVLIKQLKQATLQKLASIPQNPNYADLVRVLIIESLMNMCEKNVFVQCRKEDEAVVSAQLDSAAKGYCDLMSKASGKSITVNLTLDKDNYLAPAPVAGSEAVSCCGGVVLHAKNRKIICKNTLDSRLDIAFDALTPQLRGVMFGFRDAPGARGQIV